MYNDAPVNKEEVFEPFLEPAEVSANFAQWQEQVVKADDGELDPTYLLPGERIIRPFALASTFVDPPKFSDRYGFTLYHD